MESNGCGDVSNLKPVRKQMEDGAFLFVMDMTATLQVSGLAIAWIIIVI